MRKQILLFSLMLSVASSVFAEEVQIDGLWYNLEGTTAEVIKYKNNVMYSGDIVIPSTVSYNDAEYSVTSIGMYAFAYCSGLTSLTIPNSVKSIGYGAFYENRDLTSITIPNSVTTIDGDAFAYCRGLTSITIPKSVMSIGYADFRFCSSLTAIVVEEGNTKYDSRNNCNAIIETSSNTLMVGCQNTIIPNSVTTIGIYAFAGHSSSSVEIPNSVTSIGRSAFSCCYDLTSIEIPSSVTSIGQSAFESCRGLTSITIPNSVTTIGEETFLGSGITSIMIPNSVTSIGTSAFQQCYNLSYVTIPTSVESIEKLAFHGCRSLTDVYCYATVPIMADQAFDTISNYFCSPISNVTLHVPTASIDAYKTTAPWSGFKEIVESDKLDVADLNIKAGESNTQEISLSNGLTNLVGFQMDLTLPEGVGIDKSGCSLSNRITDEEQELKIGKLESGDYRITSTSLSLMPISGNDGALLTLKLTAEDGCVGGQAILSNIIFSTAESEKVVMSDKTFDISILYDLTYKVDGQVYKDTSVVYGTAITPLEEPTKEGYTFSGWSEIPETMPSRDVEITGNFYLYGDVNTDEEVDVVDVVDIARFVVATPSANFREKLADLNFDNTVNIADAVTLVNFIAGDQNFSRMMTPSRESYDYDLCQLQLLSNGSNALSLCLDGAADFTAFQFEVELPENTDITAMSINGQRMDDHEILYNKVGENRYRVAVLSLSNAIFKGNAGELLNISIDGLTTNEISVYDIHFVTKNGTDITFDALALSGTVTGIANVRSDEDHGVIFDLQGRKLSKTQRGVNIVDGKKVVMK